MIINSVVAGVSQGGGETLEALNRAAGVETGSKVLINPKSDNIQEGPFKPDSNFVSNYIYTSYDANQYSAGYGYLDTYFEPNDTLFGCRPYYPPRYSSSSNTGGSVIIPVAKFDDQSNKLSYLNETYPMCYPSSFSSAIQLEPNSKYGATFAVSTSGVGTSTININYWNTVTETYESTSVTNIDVRELNYSYVSGVWSYDWEYLFLSTRYDADGFPYNVQVIKINRDSETGILSLTKICDDAGVLGNTTSSSYRVLPSVNDYSFGYGSGTTFYKIYKFTGSSIELVRDLTSSYSFSILAKDWFFRASSSGYSTGYVYTLNGEDTPQVHFSVPNCYQTSSTPMKIAPNGSTNTFSNLNFIRIYGTSNPYTNPQFLYFDNLTLPTSVKVINSQTDSRIVSSSGFIGCPFIFKDVIMYQGQVLYKDGVKVETPNTMPIKTPDTSNSVGTINTWNIDEYHNTIIYPGSNGYCWFLDDTSTPYNVEKGGVYAINESTCFKDFMNNGSQVVSINESFYNNGFQDEITSSGSLLGLNLFSGELFIHRVSLNGPQGGSSGYYPRAVIYDNMAVGTVRGYISATEVNPDATTKSVTVSQSGNCHLGVLSNDKTKIYDFVIPTSTTSTTFSSVQVGTIDYDNNTITWDETTEAWTCNIPPYPNLFENNSPYGFGNGLAKQIKRGLQYLGRGGYFYLDEENKQLVIKDFPENVTSRVDVSKVKTTQVFYDSRFSLITDEGNYLFSYTNNDLETAVFESFLPSSFTSLLSLLKNYISATYGLTHLLTGPYYTSGRTYAFDCCYYLGYQLYKKKEDSTGGYSYVAMDLNSIFFNKESLTGFVEEKAIDSNGNSYVKVKTVTA